MTVPDIPAEKRSVGLAAAALVEDGMAVGLGTGSTVAEFVPALGRRHLSITCVATSPATAALAVAHDLDVRPFTDIARLDLAIDGADQVDPAGWLVKGGGGAHTRERIVAAAADRFVVIVSSDKTVERLHPPVPLELLAFGLAATLRALPGRRGATRHRRRTGASSPTTTASSTIPRGWPSGSTRFPGSSRTACSRRRWSAPSSWRGATRWRCVRSAEPGGRAPGDATVVGRDPMGRGRARVR